MNATKKPKLGFRHIAETSALCKHRYSDKSHKHVCRIRAYGTYRNTCVYTRRRFQLCAKTKFRLFGSIHYRSIRNRTYCRKETKSVILENNRAQALPVWHSYTFWVRFISILYVTLLLMHLSASVKQLCRVSCLSLRVISPLQSLQHLSQKELYRF